MKTGYERVVEALEAAGHTLKGSSTGNAVTTCPAHDDSRPSLSVKEGDDGRALVYCHVGCGYPDVIAALGLELKDLQHADETAADVDLYVYTDEEGRPLTRVIRTQVWLEKKKTWDKTFSQQRWTRDPDDFGTWVSGLADARRVLYRLPEVIAARSRGETIYLVEGEKDADNLALVFGVTATTNLGGAGAWRDEYAETLRGARVVVVADADDVGRRAAEVRADSLRDLPGTEVSVVLPREGKDATDHIFAGYGVDQFVAVNGLDIFEPLEWEGYEAPPVEWLLEPYVPAGKRVLAFGPNGSLKSLWAMWLAANLAREGRRVAYFSLEMTSSETKSRMQSLPQVPADKFELFRSFDFWNGDQVEIAKRKFKGYALIVIDSWSAAHNLSRRRDQNAEVAALDAEVFLPLVEATGATLLIIDNTGHPFFVDGKKQSPDRARGASAKGDKMDYTLIFERPYEDNNFLTTLAVKKIRLDVEHPGDPVEIATPRDRIEFFHVTKQGTFGRPMWPAVRGVAGYTGITGPGKEGTVGGDLSQPVRTTTGTKTPDGMQESPRVGASADTPASVGGGGSSRGPAAPEPSIAEQLRRARESKALGQM